MECYSLQVLAGDSPEYFHSVEEFPDEGSRHREIGARISKLYGRFKHIHLKLLYYANDPGYLRCEPVLIGELDWEGPSRTWKKLRDLHHKHWCSTRGLKGR